MGKGDIKSKKGKRWAGSYGKVRPHKIKVSTAAAIAPVAVEAAPAEKKAKKPAAKKEA